MRPARCTPIQLAATDATSSSAAARNTWPPPTSHCVRRPVLRKNTGIMTSSTWWRSRSIRRWSNQSRVHHHPGQERADHEVQAGPVGAQRAQRQPDQPDVPAVALLRRRISHAECPGRHARRRPGRPACRPRAPVHQDQRQHAPDGDVVQAGVAQDALAQRLRRMPSFSMNRIRIGSAVTAQAMPTPRRTARSACGPIQPRPGQHHERSQRSRTAAARPAPARR
jgi:hypothetical protein